MKKPVFFSLFLILLSVTVIANLFPQSMVAEKERLPELIPVHADAATADPNRTPAPMAPSPEKLLLIGLGMVSLIVHRRIYLDRKS